MKSAMPLLLAGALGLLFPCAATAQNDSATLDDLMRSAEQWAKENLNDDALRVLQSVDQQKVKKLLNDLQKEFQGEYVIDLAQLKEAAQAVLPLLEQYHETLPYAVWLRSRLDYLDVAEQFRLIIPPPKGGPGKPVPAPA